jgi:integrase
MPKAQKKADFPLWLHTPTGQWCKKVKQKVYYFGTDKDEAAKRWYLESDAIHAGVTPESKDEKPTIVELANVFQADQRLRYSTTGKPGLRQIELCEMTIKRLISIVGETKRAEDLGPRDFAKIKLELFKPIKRTKAVRGKVFGRTCTVRAPETVAGDVRRIKVFLNWCFHREYTPAPRYGDSFPTETAVAITKASLKKQVRKDLSGKDIKAVIEKAGVNYKPLIWLAINSGLGAGDIAAIEFEDIADIDKKECWVNLARLKTGAERRFLMWPETQKAIKEYLKVRRSPIRSHEHLVFLTNHGLPWVRGEGHHKRVDTAGSTFTKLRKLAGLERGSFYDIRRTFATVACETLDFEAVRQCMGHVKDKRNMLAGYVQGISDDRIRKVSDHVRKWFNAKVAK